LKYINLSTYYNQPLSSIPLSVIITRI
jgi:hypothetical protein